MAAPKRSSATAANRRSLLPSRSLRLPRSLVDPARAERISAQGATPLRMDPPRASPQPTHVAGREAANHRADPPRQSLRRTPGRVASSRWVVARSRLGRMWAPAAHWQVSWRTSHQARAASSGLPKRVATLRQVALQCCALRRLATSLLGAGSHPATADRRRAQASSYPAKEERRRAQASCHPATAADRQPGLADLRPRQASRRCLGWASRVR
jgi:hypothetical protein